MSSDIFDRAITLAGVDPIAVVLCGSHLYNTVIDPHDYDVTLFVPTGKSSQHMSGELDVRVVSLEFLLKIGTKGYLYEVDSVLGLLYGHGEFYDHPWSPALWNYRPSIWGYADTVRRFKVKNPEAIKHITRYDIFLERFWTTGNADPRLTDEERQLWLKNMTS